MPTLVKPVSYGPSSAADPAQDRRYGGALGMSALLHGIAVGLLLLITLVLSEREEDRAEVFEVVAGEGDDFGATEAPSGSEQGEAVTGEIQMPTLESVPTWTPPTPVAEVVPVEPVPAPPAPVVEPVPVPNFARDMKSTLRAEQRKTQRELREQRAKEAAAAKAEAERQRTSYEEFRKKQGTKSTASSSTAKADPGKRIDTSSIKKGVTGGAGAGSTGAGGKALSAAERDRMEAYFAMLISRLRDSHEKPAGLSDLLNAEVQFTLGPTGAISGARISRSSGNAEFDRSVLEAFARVRMPTRPDGKTSVERLVFRMREA